MSSVPPPPPGLESEFHASYVQGDVRRSVALIEQYWSRLIFDPAASQRVFDVVGSATIDELADSPRASLLAEGVGGLAHGTTRFHLPVGPDAIQQAIRAGRGRKLVEIAILAMVAERVQGRAETALELAATSRPLLQATSTTRFSPAVELVAYWHLQAAQAAFHAGDFERARLDFEHAWSHRDNDITGYVASSTAPFGILLAALAGDHRELGRWQMDWAEISGRTANLIEADTMARPALIADLLIATDHLEDDLATQLVDTLEPQLLYDELWPLTLWAMVRHLVDVGAVVRARNLVAAVLDRHEVPGTGRSIHRSFAPLAQTEIALAEGRLAAILPLLERARPSALPGLDGLYAVCAHLAAGDVIEARRQAVLAERTASHPRVLRECRYFLAVCDQASARPNTDTAHFDPDLRRLVAHLPSAMHQAAASLSGAQLPPSRAGEPDDGQLIYLTPAEQRALLALAGPGSLADVAADLHLSRNTLKTQTRGLYRKLNAGSRDEMIALARRHGLLPDD